MLALVAHGSGRRREIRRVTLLGMTALYAETAKRRDAERVARELTRLRVDRVCFAEGYPYKDAFHESLSFREADAYGLVAALLTDVAQTLSDKHAAAYLCGNATRECDEALETLCLHNRWLMVDGCRSSALEDLRRRTGVSIVESPGAERLRSARLAVFTAPPQREIELPHECVALAADLRYLAGIRGWAHVTGVEVVCSTEPILPDWFPRDALLAEAVTRGALRRDVLTIAKIFVTQS